MVNSPMAKEKNVRMWCKHSLVIMHRKEVLENLQSSKLQCNVLETHLKTFVVHRHTYIGQNTVTTIAE